MSENEKKWGEGRRNFLKLTGVIGLAVGAGAFLSGCDRRSPADYTFNFPEGTNRYEEVEKIFAGVDPEDIYIRNFPSDLRYWRTGSSDVFEKFGSYQGYAKLLTGIDYQDGMDSNFWRGFMFDSEGGKINEYDIDRLTLGPAYKRIPRKALAPEDEGNLLVEVEFTDRNARSIIVAPRLRNSGFDLWVVQFDEKINMKPNTRMRFHALPVPLEED